VCVVGDNASVKSYFRRVVQNICKYAEIEFAATRLTKSGVTVEAWVMLHSGSHTVARQALAELADQPLLTWVPRR
jgi:hypothetical protein